MGYVIVLINVNFMNKSILLIFGNKILNVMNSTGIVNAPINNPVNNHVPSGQNPFGRPYTIMGFA